MSQKRHETFMETQVPNKIPIFEILIQLPNLFKKNHNCYLQFKKSYKN